jgi:AAA domain
MDEIKKAISDAEAAKLKPLLLSSGAFVKTFVPPDYVIVGILLRGYVYAFTAPMSYGKTAVALRFAFHVACGLPLHDREVEKGCVLYFAGENCVDVTMRWIKLCEEMDVKPEDVDVYFMRGASDLSDDSIRQQIHNEAVQIGRPISLVIVDTSAAFYTGDSEQDRTQMGKHAVMFRSFTVLPGRPAIMILCHPIKNFDPEKMVPAGGGTFLNAIDGNLVCLREAGSMVVDAHWQVKIVGVSDFPPLSFRLVVGYSEKLKDSKGRSLSTVFAKPITDAERGVMDEKADAEKYELLSLMREKPGFSLAAMAKELGWLYSDGKANKTKVNRALKALEAAKLVTIKNSVWELTKAGMQAASPRQPPQGDMPF